MNTPGLFLSCINLQNFATFENQTVQFDNSFNAVIGETGSGKSLIMDAIQLVLGGRADRKVIRKSADFASVEAVFQAKTNSAIKKFFDDLGFPFQDQEIVIKRLIYSNGRTKTFLNYQSCSSQVLREVARRFVDLVGQFDNQKLLSPEYQLSLLDEYAALGVELLEYQESWKKLQELKSNLEQALGKRQERSQREEFLKFQLEELDRLEPSLEDEEALLSKKESFLFIQRQKENYQSLLSNLEERDAGNVLGLLRASIRLLEQGGHEKSSQLLEKLLQAQQLVEEVSFGLSKDMEDGESEGHLEEVLDRLDKYQRLKRKFHTDTEGLQKLRDEFADELNGLSKIDHLIKSQKKEIASLETKLSSMALKLHKKRSTTSKDLSSLLTRAVQELKMVGASLEFKVEKMENLGPKGFSQVDLMAETNPGEGSFKIKDIASGGELSRVLLALRQVLSQGDSISVFLFDEIDTGMGGETALAIGASLKKVAKNSQVIAITHLPQIANFAQKLIQVSKQVKGPTNGQTRTVSLVEEIVGKSKRRHVEAMTPLQ